MAPNPVIQAVDRLATKIVGELHNLFGFSYSRATEHFVYQLTIQSSAASPPAAVPAGTVLRSSLRITDEADFVCTRIAVTSRLAVDGGAADEVGSLTAARDVDSSVNDGDAIIDPACLIRFTASSSDRNLSNEAIDVAGAYGVRGDGGVLTRPRLFGRSTTLAVELTSLQAIAAGQRVDWRVILSGWKIYAANALNLTRRRV